MQVMLMKVKPRTLDRKEGTKMLSICYCYSEQLFMYNAQVGWVTQTQGTNKLFLVWTLEGNGFRTEMPISDYCKNADCFI